MHKIQFKKEISDVSRSLEKHHSIFYKMWEFGTPELSENVQTAAVKFDPKSYKPLKFLFNPEFWNRLENDSRAFIVAHECLHAILNHGTRANHLLSNKNTKQNANVALDLAVNHMLVNSFGFDRNNISISEEGCWVDTIFKNRNVPSNLSFEEYYELLCTDQDKSEGSDSSDDDESQGDKKQNKKNTDLVSDKSENNSDDNSEQEQSGDDEDSHGNDEDPDRNKDDSRNGDEDSNQNEDDSKPENPQNNQSKVFDDHDDFTKFDLKDLMQIMSGDLENEDVDSAKEIISAHGCGNDIPSSFEIPKLQKMRPSAKWEKIVKEWKRIGINPPDDSEQWAKMPRRTSSLPSDIILPAYDENVDDDFCISKLNAWIFLDVSGSCIHLKDRFFMAYDTISPKRFNKRMFIFADRVAEIKQKEISGQDCHRVGEGTNFMAVEKFVRNEVNNEKSKPDIIMVITDGDSIHPENYVLVEKWHWFCENVNKSAYHCDSEYFNQLFDNYLQRINPKSHKHILSDFFVIN
jgi:predicted metal-dependent peptidase